MCGWVCELVFFVVPFLEVYEKSEVVESWHHSYARSGEFGAELVEAPHADAFDGAIDEVGGNWRVVGGLLGKVGDSDWLVRGVDMLFRRFFVRFSKYWRDCVLDFPVALMRWSTKRCLG